MDRSTTSSGKEQWLYKFAGRFGGIARAIFRSLVTRSTDAYPAARVPFFSQSSNVTVLITDSTLPRGACHALLGRAPEAKYRWRE